MVTSITFADIESKAVTVLFGEVKEGVFFEALYTPRTKALWMRKGDHLLGFFNTFGRHDPNGVMVYFNYDKTTNIGPITYYPKMTIQLSEVD